ncbi:T9SS sorting signal type C domain-containing protein [Flavobacterium sp. N1719]|uniref:glycine-rich domain-containing protein n=1 Tax=Flavobacterium sp. N1719 TaxID=2885633 RepID=UPI002223C4C1|nr:T9SS sorting signal type C domain-containing protein [Flavobacterium sp. N1719]
MEKMYTQLSKRCCYLFLLFLFFGNVGQLMAQSSTYNADGTFTAPHNTSSVTVECWGGGGRGGSTASNGTETGGGGGGAYARKNAQAVTPNSNYTVVVGVGSTGTTAGGDSYFNTAATVMAKGGNSVANNTAGGATGGSAAASVGDVKFSGGNGANGSNGNNGGGGGSSAGTAANGTNGGSPAGGVAPTGGGNGGAGRSGSNGNGNAGSIPGGGGGGVLSGNTNSRTGGAGANGRVVVSWTCSNVLTSGTGTNNQTICFGSAITTITYTCSGAYGATFAGLPAGVTGTYTDGSIVISGTPTVTGVFNYTVTPTGSCTSSIVTGTLTVNPKPTDVTATASQSSICVGSSVNLTAAANSNIFSTPITVFSENFNAGTNSWTLTNTGTGGTPALADWTLRANGYTVSSETFNSNDASQFYMSNSDAQGNGSTTATILQSPAFSTVGMNSANLTFYHYYRYNGSETGLVQISTNGTTWTTLSGPYTATQGTSTNFSLVTLNINAYINQPTVYVRFKYDASWDWYWAVDNVTVSGISSTPDDCTYAWTSSPAGFTSSLKNPSGVTPSVTTTYTVVATNALGCSTSASTTVTVNNYVTASVNIAASQTTICEGTNVTFTATPTNGGTTPSYQWKVNGNNVGTDSATYASTSLVNGDVVTVVMISNATPCVNGTPATSNSISMTVIPSLPASVSIAASTTTICEGTSVTFTATPTNGGTTPSYQWKVNGNNVGTDNALYTTTALQNGDVVTVVMTSNASPCLTGSPATSNSVTMTVNPLASASITASNGPSQCYGSDISFTVSGTTNAILYYNLNGGGTQFTILTGGSATITVTGATASQTLNLVSVDNGQCPVTLSETATVAVNTTTWDGTSWSDGTPDATKAAFVTGNLTIASNLQACALVISNNAIVSVASGSNVTLENAISVAAGSSFTVNSNANLIQVNPNAVNSGNIVVKRTSNPLIRLDYILWGSPVAGQNLFNFSPLTSVNPNIRFYQYNPATNIYNSIADYATHTMQAGKGYLIRLPFNHPTAAAVWNGSFTGVPNNGTYNVTLGNNGAGFRYNAVSNPYPSTLDIAQFFSENASNVEPTLYFWRKTNNATKPSYCTWNMDTDTFVDNGEAYTESPNGIIQVGQGFFVEAKGSATSVVFNNTQRVGNNANQMFKSQGVTTQNAEKHRIWLNITSGNDFAQAVVGYFSNGTLAADATDSKLFNDGNLALTAPINGEHYIVNGRPVPFDAADVVPLSYKATTAGTMTITIDHVDGLFASGTQDIYLHDLTNNTYNSLNQGPYVFQSQAGTFTNRFELVYQNALSNHAPSLSNLDFQVIRTQNVIRVQAQEMIDQVLVFDLQGRLITQLKKLNQQQAILSGVSQDQTYLVRVVTTSGKTGVKKVM